MTDIVIVGEAWGKDEEDEGAPFVGAAGRLLTSLLAEVGIKRSECHLTNVFNLRPPGGNDVSYLCGPKTQGIPGRPAISSGKYIRAEYAPELERLEQEIAHHKPNVIIALGNAPLWALTGVSGIRKVRGAPTLSTSGYKLLPTYHPSSVLRDWTLRPIVLADLYKARRESAYPEVRRPQRFIHFHPTIEDLFQFERDYIIPSDYLSVDIETKNLQITEIGFAPTADRALVVPFWQRSRGPHGYSYWSESDELEAWKWVRRILSLPKTVVGQNFIYDMMYLWKTVGIPVPFASGDTMLLHHALQPELQKGLGFLASIYTDEASWKFMRTTETLKREDS